MYTLYKSIVDDLQVTLPRHAPELAKRAVQQNILFKVRPQMMLGNLVSFVLRYLHTNIQTNRNACADIHCCILSTCVYMCTV